jgi:hypothetical protein
MFKFVNLKKNEEKQHSLQKPRFSSTTPNFTPSSIPKSFSFSSRCYPYKCPKFGIRDLYMVKAAISGTG